MTIQIIPLNATASQSFTILLGNQNCSVKIYQLSTGLYCNLIANNNPIFNTMICLNLVGLIREAYLGFVGQLAFVDTKGTSDPTYDGLGARYQLVYQA